MNETELVIALEGMGVHVAFLPYPLAGAYYHAPGLVIVDSRLPPGDQVAVLAHEYVHALMGHDGCQDDGVEALVDRRAARLMVSEAEYALAERLHEGCRFGIAEELGLPVWVVEAYRCSLES